MAPEKNVDWWKAPSTATCVTVAVVSVATFAGVYYLFFKNRRAAGLPPADANNPLDADQEIAASAKDGDGSAKRKDRPVLLVNPDIKYELELIEKAKISHDTRHFKFALPSNDHVLGLPVGQHIFMSATIDGKNVVRPYTPISSDDDEGFTMFMIKVYFRGVNKTFPEGGKMSQHLESLPIGGKINIRGPSGLIIYRGMGDFHVRQNKSADPVHHCFTHIGLIAGGTGITPMVQIIRAILKNPDDTTKISLLYANQTEEDILMRKDLEELQVQDQERFKLWYTVDHEPKLWRYSVGFINSKMIQQHLPVAEKDSAIFMCGPLPMIKFACAPSLDKIEFPDEKRFIF